MKIKYIFIAFTIASLSWAQNIISGTITDFSNLPIATANVYIKDSYDGGSTNKQGFFTFETTETQNQTLIIEKSGYITLEIPIEIPLKTALDFQLEKELELQDVIFTAGSLKAKSNTNEAILSSLDVVTTASAVGDAIGAFQTLPGTTVNANDGRLFVRGGDASETAITIDGMQVFQPYGASVNNIPTRSRFSPFLFKGLVLNTGGYDVNFGNALSGIVEFNTEDFTQQNEWQFDVMTIGLGARLNKRWEKDGLTLSTAYFNLSPYNQVFKTRDEWQKSPQGMGGEMVYRHQFSKGILKSYMAYEKSDLEVIQSNINYPDGITFKLQNQNFYTNTTYQHHFHKKLNGFMGISYGDSNTDLAQNAEDLDTKNKGLNAKMQLEWKYNKSHKFIAGTEWLQVKNDIQSIGDFQSNTSLWATYIEDQWMFYKNFGLKYGLRSEWYNQSKTVSLAPRVSLAYKLNEHNNFNVVLGRYFQPTPFNQYYTEPNVLMASNHFLFNYFYKKEKEILRVEVYHKSYENLPLLQNNVLSQQGEGSAQGFEFFYKNNGKHMSNLSYWVTYSYIDSKRIYQDYPQKATPNFVSKHNFSFVGKYWISDLRSQLGFDYQFNSGKPYTNPNTDGFLNQTSKPYHTINLSWAFLYRQHIILFASVSNALNFKNNFGYEYANQADVNGYYNSEAILPANNQFFFLGIFITLSKDKTKNQLDNL